MAESVDVRDLYDAPVVDPGIGVHLWCVMAAYEVRDIKPVNDVSLAADNLLTVRGPGCFKCHKMYEPGVENTLCKGEVY